eukprot:13129225-Alexandrium_andersonii.AAC.1
MRKGAVCRSVRLTDAGRAAARAAQRPVAAASVDKVTLMSLFDGIGGATQALRLAGVEVAAYAASETDPQAQRVVRHAWPD